MRAGVGIAGAAVLAVNAAWAAAPQRLEPIRDSAIAFPCDRPAGADRPQDSTLAARFAPILRFAPGELIFPTFPFFTAWDGVDNDGDGIVDLADADEVAPRVDSLYDPRVTGPLPLSFDRLINYYRTAASNAAETRRMNLRRSAVLYRICELPSDS